MDLLVDQIGEVLYPLYGDHGDSGIDSDGNEQLADALHRFMNMVDRNRNGPDSTSEVSSDDEAEHPAPAPAPASAPARSPQHWGTYYDKSNDEEFSMALEDGSEGVDKEVKWPMAIGQPERRRVNGNASSEENCASPPLYEVELTASDEDDDGSVLELVIPMQPARYKRVPTSSPKKHKQNPNLTNQRVFCCVAACWPRLW